MKTDERNSPLLSENSQVTYFVNILANKLNKVTQLRKGSILHKVSEISFSIEESVMYCLLNPSTNRDLRQ
jgi:hypothetical protein